MDGVADAGLFAPISRRAQPEAVGTPDENATCSINYTSGTTARPKGVQLTHRNCSINAITFGWHTTVTDRDVLLHTLPMFHCNGWGMPYAATGMGAKHVVLRKVDGEQILRRVEAEGVTLMCGAPAVVSAILDAATQRSARGEDRAGPRDRSGRRRRCSAAQQHHRAGRDRSRLGVHSDLRPHRDRPAAHDQPRARRVGRARAPATAPDGSRAPARLRSGSACASTRADEVSARANQMFAGYWNQPEDSAKVLVDGWFHTGDGGYMDGPFLVISDRKKDVIISGGENVSSIEVEDVLYGHPAVAEAAVIGVPDEKWGETVMALVVLRPATRRANRS